LKYHRTNKSSNRYGQKKQTDASFQKTYTHALNSTLCATERALCCVLENYQTEEGLNVPEVLRKYIPGQPEFLPFVKELPKDSTSLKAKGKAEMKGGSAPKIPGEGEVVERPKAVAEEKRS
jgi:seryl-tRNA synthetase